MPFLNRDIKYATFFEYMRHPHWNYVPASLEGYISPIGSGLIKPNQT